MRRVRNPALECRPDHWAPFSAVAEDGWDQRLRHCVCLSACRRRWGRGGRGRRPGRQAECCLSDCLAVAPLASAARAAESPSWAVDCVVLPLHCVAEHIRSGGRARRLGGPAGQGAEERCEASWVESVWSLAARPRDGCGVELLAADGADARRRGGLVPRDVGVSPCLRLRRGHHEKGARLTRAARSAESRAQRGNESEEQQGAESQREGKTYACCEYCRVESAMRR